MSNLLATESKALQVTAAGAFGAAVTAYLSGLDVRDSTREQYRRNLAQFGAWLERTGRDFRGLTRADVVAYKVALQSPAEGEDTPRLSARTAGAYLVSVRGLLAYISAEYGGRDLGKGISNPRTDCKRFVKQHLTAQQCTDLLNYYESRGRYRDYAIVTLLLRCGLRTIEVTRLNVDSITTRAGKRVLSVWGKGHSTADSYVILSDKAHEAVRNYLATRGRVSLQSPLFVSSSNRNSGKRLTTRTIRNVVDEGLRAIGLEGHEYSAHSLRHTTAVALISSGAQLTDVQDVLRHRSVSTSQIYIESIRETQRIARAVETQLDNLF